MPNPFSSLRFGNVYGDADYGASGYPSPYQNFGGKRFMSSIYPNQTPPEPPPPRPTFGPPADAPSYGQGFGAEQPAQDEGGKYFDEIQRIRGMRGPAVSAYQAHLNAMPTEKSTEPSLGRKILGGVAAMGLGWNSPERGINAGQEVLDTPYKDAIRDWSNKAKGLGESAKLEQQDAETQYQALAQARALGLKYDEYRLKQLENNRTFGINTQREATRARVADLTAQRDAATNTRERNRIDAEIDRAKRQLDINRDVADTGRMNAKTGQINAETNKTRAQTYVASQQSLNNYRTARLDQLAKASQATPNELSKAMESALTLLAREPAFKDFIDTKTYPPVVKDPSTYMGSPQMSQYQAFNRRLREAIDSQINQGKLLLGDEGADGSDGADQFEIGNPEF